MAINWILEMVKLENVEELKLNISHRSIKIGNIRDVKINGNNCSVDIYGKSESFNAKIDNRNIDVNNEVIKKFILMCT